MTWEDLDCLPILQSFAGLKRGDAVYVRKYGTGEIISFYEGEIIVGFSGLRKRFSAREGNVSMIPATCLKRTKTKVEVKVNGKKMSLAEYKKKCRIEKKLAKITTSVKL